MFLDSYARSTDVGSADPALAGELHPSSPLQSTMPRGFRDDGTSKDHSKPRANFLDSFLR